ncbi:glycerate kinase type-2 family protein [Halomarina rubra]|uniref:Glycerate kinase n=1 Tax=Halomarina rubra TaxID=2071873 RepID=A0ABD6AQ36_9EURY
MTHDSAADRAARYDLARECIEAGVAAADPERAVTDQLSLDGESLTAGEWTVDLAGYDRVVVAGGGKASAAVTRGLVAVLGERLDDGLVVTDGDDAGTDPVDVALGDHPVPSERNVAATDRLCDLLDAADERTLVLAPVTGGGSALLAAPTVPLGEFRDLTEALVESGATINEINAVRKRLSRVKGGRLAARAAPATVLALLVSDVVGDDPATVASGPFTPDETGVDEALAVLSRYDVDASDAVRQAVETATTHAGPFEHVHTHLLASGRTAIDAAADRAREAGYDPLVLSSRMRGEARELALAHVAVAEEVLASGDPAPPPLALLSGGELTVTVRGDGVGGPNLEFALAAALECPPHVTLVSVDTDGRDGGTDVAGAAVDSATVEDVARARQSLASNDTLPHLGERDALLTVDSATNVNDLRVVLVDAPERLEESS